MSVRVNAVICRRSSYRLSTGSYIDFREAVVEGLIVKFVSVKKARSPSCPSERFDEYKGGQVPSDCIMTVCAGICHEPLSVLSQIMQCLGLGQRWTDKPPLSSVYIPHIHSLSLSLRNCQLSMQQML